METNQEMLLELIWLYFPVLQLELRWDFFLVLLKTVENKFAVLYLYGSFAI